MTSSKNSSIEDYKEIISLGFNEEVEKGDAYLQWISEPEPNQPMILSLSTLLQIVTVSVMILFVLIGSYFKIIMYAYMYLRYKLKEQGPIDMLILTSSTIQHTGNVLYVFHYIMMTLNNTTLQNILGPWYCFLFIHLMTFEIVYLVVGSFGLSLFRILYIKKDDWVKYGIGEKNLGRIIFVGGILLSGYFATLQSSDTIYQDIIHQHCSHPGETFVKTMIEFNHSRGKNMVFSLWYQQGIAIVLFLMAIGEMTCYVTFFYHLYRHDNQERYRRLLGSGVIQARNRQNATTFLGQFFCFMSELVLLFFVCSSYHDFRTIFPLFRTMVFAVLSIVEILTSYQLRSRMFNPFEAMI